MAYRIFVKRRLRRHRGRRTLEFDCLERRVVLATFTVTNTNDSGSGSLRYAMESAALSPGHDAITFNIGGGGGAHTIAPNAPLPSILDTVLIDATTQPGYAGTPLIELSGASAGPAHGFHVLSGGTTIRGFVINRFAFGSGIEIVSDGNVVEGNYLGTDRTGMIAFGNVNGVQIHEGASFNRVGTNGDGVLDERERNVISGNVVTGVGIRGADALHNVVAGNFIGPDASGTQFVGIQERGVDLYFNTQFNVIGTNGDGQGDAVEGNVISGNLLRGIHNGSPNNVIAGNVIGLDVTQTLNILDNSFGIELFGDASFTRIGTNGDGVSDHLEGNVIGGIDNMFAIWIHTSHNVIAGNTIGSGTSDPSPRSNRVGIQFEAGSANNRVGTNFDGISDPLERNIVVGNLMNGITLRNSHDNLIAGNVVSANQRGIVINFAGSQRNLVMGNLIGTDESGTLAWGNIGVGIDVRGQAKHNVIGTNGDAVNDHLERNTISGNLEHGIRIRDTGTDFNVVAGNLIGTDVTGVAPLGNGMLGVVIGEAGSPLSNRIGTNGDSVSDALEANVIAYNFAGIHLFSFDGGFPRDNSIRGNSIHLNVGNAIDLGSDGPTLNDPHDTDDGANRLQNHPVINGFESGISTRIVGSFHSAPETTFLIDFYATVTTHAFGFAEGERYLGGASVTTNAAGDATFDVVLSAATSPGELITATATDPNGNTSEFSVNSPPMAVAGGPYSIVEGGVITLDASGSSDLNQATSSLIFEWDLDGDGVFGESGVGAAQGDEIGIRPLFSATGLDGPGAVTVSLRVTDDGGLTSSDTATIEFTNAAPILGAISGPASVSVGSAALFSAHFSDPGIPDTHTCIVSWGDSTSSLGTISESGGTGTCTATHTYFASASFTVSFTISDDDLGSDSALYAINNVARSAFILNPTLCGSLTAAGNGETNFDGPITVASSCAVNAISASGNAQIAASRVDVVGVPGWRTTGNATITPTPTNISGPVADPLASAPAPGDAAHLGIVNCSGNVTQSIDPGVYERIQASGGCMLTMNPGSYIVAGGGFHVSGNASVTGAQVTIYNAGSNFPDPGGSFGSVQISGNGAIYLTPPVAGPLNGIVIFQARDNDQRMSLSGNGMAITGTIYAATAQLRLDGNGVLQASLVVDTLRLSGNAWASLTAENEWNASDANLANSQLLMGVQWVSIEGAEGAVTSHQLARIRDAIATINATWHPYGVNLFEVGGEASGFADIRIQIADSSLCGTVAQGVLGCSTSFGDITFLRGWDWYDGADTNAIGADQYDYQTIAMHELGHAIGLAHSPDTFSAMNAALGTGVTRRTFTAEDLERVENSHARGDVDHIGHALYAAEPAELGGALEPRNVWLLDTSTTGISRHDPPAVRPFSRYDAEDVLIGGAGDDMPIGRSSRDLLLGGTTVERPQGADDRIVELTAYSAHDAAVSLLLTASKQPLSNYLVDFELRLSCIGVGPISP
jgi:parallel beta-helix repeat protein